jgi:hypothetical protein
MKTKKEITTELKNLKIDRKTMAGKNYNAIDNNDEHLMRMYQEMMFATDKAIQLLEWVLDERK